jgi:hypothetical protein
LEQINGSEGMIKTDDKKLELLINWDVEREKREISKLVCDEAIPLFIDESAA